MEIRIPRSGFKIPTKCLVCQKDVDKTFPFKIYYRGDTEATKNFILELFLCQEHNQIYQKAQICYKKMMIYFGSSLIPFAIGLFLTTIAVPVVVPAIIFGLALALSVYGYDMFTQSSKSFEQIRKGGLKIVFVTGSEIILSIADKELAESIKAANSK